MKKIVRWTAVYETEIEVNDGESPRECCDFPIDVNGSEYQEDTFEVISIEDKKDNG